MPAGAPISNVPANVITGFLGVGKTTAIRHLLQSKPRDERWAVLVNEFGEVGVDGGLFGAEKDGEVFIREVPGGCMCCAAGLPMQVALNQLLARARPQRLLIEPTGLGHPREVLAALADAVRAGVLDLRATVTLVDARSLEDERYLRSETFQQQLAVADMVVANKSDLYRPGDLQNLQRFLEYSGNAAAASVQTVEQGRIDSDWLQGPSRFRATAEHDAQRLPQAHSAHTPASPDGEEPWPACGFHRLENSGEGYHSCGWLFDPALTFDYQRLFSLISGAGAERLKGVFITERGVFGFNKVDAVLSVMELDDTLDSRVEVIDRTRGDWDAMESDWLNTLSSD
ncbi:CobW family GTP-binding protein [Microbulbifer celer]|uniref:CobW family GTP-binding protein n=1 Tax=Microbulbifer celer TaxID=435905 RepID=A0ABW3U9D5_9GAMM|nr:GTP-binding protein [Microbulbifer celer]UFN56568.1 GTP-binding protein [Microbulbifer celer]